MDFSLPRKDIIRSKKDIDALLSEGDVIFRYPFKVYYRRIKESATVRMMVSVPKRNFKRAVKRNLIKRRVREAFRLNRSEMGGCGMDMLFVYLGKDILEYAAVESKLREIFSLLHVDTEEGGKLSSDIAG